MRAPTTSLAAALALAALTAAPLAAQYDPWGPKSSYVEAGGSIRIQYPWNALDIDDTQGGRTATASGRLGLAYLEASADPSNGRIKAKASGGYYTEWAIGVGRLSQLVTVTNRSDETRVQTFESYLHGTLTGQCLATYRCASWDETAEIHSMLLVRELLSPTFALDLAETNLYGRVHGGSAVRQTKEVFERALTSITLAPGERKALHVVWQVSAQAYGGFTADASRTGSLFMPTIDGIEVEAASYFLAAQSRPDWATVTTPEPGTLALVALGALVVPAVRRRRALGR